MARESTSRHERALSPERTIEVERALSLASTKSHERGGDPVTTVRQTPRHLLGASLDSSHVRFLLGVDLPEIPRELLDADIYLLTIVAAALLDGDQERPGGTDGVA